MLDCASPVKITINQLASLVMNLMRKQVPIVYKPERGGDIKNFSPDNARLTSLGVEWTDFVTGLQETIWSYVNEWTKAK
jgi:hypothetical protein